MSDPAPFVDVEAALEEVLADLVTEDKVVTWTGTNLQELIEDGPLIKVSRLGGDATRHTAAPRVDIAVYATTMAAAKPLAGRVLDRLLFRAHATAAGVIDRAEVEVLPHEVPYDDETIRLIVATYRVSTRRHVVA